VAHQLGRHLDAVDLIRQALALRLHPAFWYNLAQVHLARKDAPAAEDALRQVIMTAPNHAEALFHLGTLRRVNDDLGGAVDYYRRAVAAKSDFVDARINLGLLLDRIGESAEALLHLEAAHRLRPRDPEILNSLGTVREHSSPALAIEDFRRALALDPRSATAAVNLTRLLTSGARHHR
jgi:tetratricopeptide (TPR) repeat protein